MAEMETGVSEDFGVIADNMKSFEGFEFERVLAFRQQAIDMIVLGRLKGQAAIAVIKWQGLTEERAVQLLSGHTQLIPTLRNDIYTNFVAEPPRDLSLMDISLIWPATEKHVAKYEAQTHHVVRETPEMYWKVVLPYIESLPAERLAWVRNILEGKQEADRVLLRDDSPTTGFVLLPDLKWNLNDTNMLYCTAIIMADGLRSLRDLTANHVPLLTNVREKCLEVLCHTYGADAGVIRAFLHYHPSYYHLHIHLSHVSRGIEGTATGHAHLLDDVIENLTLDSNYYARRTLTCVLGENHPVYRLATAFTAETTPPPPPAAFTKDG